MEYRAVGLKLRDVEWSNADEVIDFIDRHRQQDYAVGDMLTLPDIDQTYEVQAVRPFRNHGTFYLFLDMDAQCAAEGCGEYFLVSVDVNRWRNSRYLTRCCPGHKGLFRTEMPGAWKTKAERDEMVALEARSTKRAEYRKQALADRQRMGVVERAVVEAKDDLALVKRSVRDTDLLAVAMVKLPRPEGRDTRKQRVVRAMRVLRERGLL